jgi:ferritin-like metal-binding protein YciE
MGLLTKDIKTMDDLLLHGLQDIYYAEQQITRALPKMIDKATNRDLSNGLKNHLEETKRQIERLENVFAKLGKQPSGTQCPAIDGLIKEADETASETEDKSVLDAAIVANAQADRAL